MIWNNYIGIDYLVSKEICNNIIEIGENKIKDGFGFKEIKKYRNDVTLSLNGFGTYKISENFKIINEAIQFSLDEFLNRFTLADSKNYSYNDHKFQKTIKGGGFWHWHFESAGKYNDRAFVWMLYLNTVEKGGKTEFYKTKNDIIKIKPEVGKFVFWPAGETHMHRATPDLEETKYILTGWVYRK